MCNGILAQVSSSAFTIDPFKVGLAGFHLLDHPTCEKLHDLRSGILAVGDVDIAAFHLSVAERQDEASLDEIICDPDIGGERNAQSLAGRRDSKDGLVELQFVARAKQVLMADVPGLELFDTRRRNRER